MRPQHFSRSEFKNRNGDWWEEMSERLVTMLDVLRHMSGKPIHISGNAFALGRHLGIRDESEHNIDFWGEVMAVDSFIEGVQTEDEARQIVDLARQIGFTGIGVYADTNNNEGLPQVMFHLGVRWNRRMGDPAVWGRVEGMFVGIDEALKALPKGV